jgi:hypothetical protein
MYLYEKDKTEKIMKTLKKSEQEVPVEIKNIDNFFDEIKNRKISFWKGLWIDISYTANEWCWTVYRFFNPCHKRIRKVIPRKWTDLTELTLLINFEIIKSYVEEEMDQISWDHHDEYKKVAEWLRSSYEYITKERNELSDEFSKALDQASDKKNRDLPYKERYEETNRIEALIDEKDKEVLIGLANYRQYLWS